MDKNSYEDDYEQDDEQDDEFTLQSTCKSYLLLLLKFFFIALLASIPYCINIYQQIQFKTTRKAILDNLGYLSIIPSHINFAFSVLTENMVNQTNTGNFLYIFFRKKL